MGIFYNLLLQTKQEIEQAHARPSRLKFTILCFECFHHYLSSRKMKEMEGSFHCFLSYNICKILSINRRLYVSCANSAVQETKGSSKSFPKHETRHLSEHKVCINRENKLLYNIYIYFIKPLSWHDKDHFPLGILLGLMG